MVDDSIDVLTDAAPADVIAIGGYQRVMGIALWVSTSGFT